MPSNHYNELTRIAFYVRTELRMLELFTRTGQFVKAFVVLRRLIYQLLTDKRRFDPD